MICSVAHDIYTVNGITIRTLRLDFARNYNVLSFRHKVSQQYLVVCWLWRLGPCLNSTLWVRSSPGAFSNFFVGGSKVDPKLHPIHKGTCGDTIHSINTMIGGFQKSKIHFSKVGLQNYSLSKLVHLCIIPKNFWCKHFLFIFGWLVRVVTSQRKVGNFWGWCDEIFAYSPFKMTYF